MMQCTYFLYLSERKNNMEKTDKLVSIVLPVYNTAKYLDKCIGCIVGQTYKNIELIIVDDKSPDDSPQICDDWQKKDSRIKVIHKEVNEGLSAARNTGLANATGDYIAFFDSDDFFDVTLVEKVINKMLEEDAEIGLFGANFYFGEDRCFPINIHAKKLVYTGREIQDELFPDMIEGSRKGSVRGLSGLPVWAYILSMDFLKSTEQTFESEREWYLEDLKFNFYLYSKLNKLVIVPDYLYYWNLSNSDSLTSRKYSLDKFIKLRKLIESLFSEREKFQYTPEIGRRIEDLFVYLTVREIIQLCVNKPMYHVTEFNIILEHIISDELFYKCLTSQGIISNWSDEIKEILNLIISRDYKACNTRIPEIINGNKDVSMGMSYQSDSDDE